MDFFRSILADDPEPETPDDHQESDTDRLANESPRHLEIAGDEDDSNSNPNSSEDSGGGLWSFGDLVKTLTTRSESVLETYRRDLKEFGTGLRKESDLFREVASRAVKELPSSIEVGTSAIDGVLKSTVDIISQGKEAILAPSDIDDSDASERHTYSDRGGLDSRRYSRFESQLNAIQSDKRTYSADPEDLDDYNKWKLGFVVGDKMDDIEKLIGENGALEGIYSKLVPNEVDDGTFWYRYFYKVDKLKQQEDLRAKLVRRSLSADDDEELSWDVDDDEEEEQQQSQQTDQLKSNTSKSQELPKDDKKESPADESKAENSKTVDENNEMNTNVAGVDKKNVEEREPKHSGGNAPAEKAESVPKRDEKADLKVDSGKEGNVSVATTQRSLQEEEDLEWDDIEDLGNIDDKKVSEGDTQNKADLRKRLSTAADDEDLSWDIEDDDEPVEAGKK